MIRETRRLSKTTHHSTVFAFFVTTQPGLLSVNDLAPAGRKHQHFCVIFLSGLSDVIDYNGEN